MSREADFMQEWQERFVHERGGADGGNYERLEAAVSAAHEGTNPVYRSYSEIRTTRATVIGACAFESISEAIASAQEGALVPPAYSSEDNAVDAGYVEYNLLPTDFRPLHADLVRGYQTLAAGDTVSPSVHNTSFSFCKGAHGQFVDTYWSRRIAAKDYGAGPERLEYAWWQSKREGGFDNFVIPSLFTDNVLAIADILVAMGTGLCIAKRRVCTADELCEFAVGNIDVAVQPTSVKRRKALEALPVGYGQKVLSGDATAIGEEHFRVTKEEGRWRGYWTHPSLKAGSWQRPEHCPASEYNPLTPRTERQSAAVYSLLGSCGFTSMYEAQGKRISSGQLLAVQALGVAVSTVYARPDWQARVLHAHRED